MKKVFIAMAIAFSMTMFAQTEEKEKNVTVPAVVKTAFAKDFSGKKVKWGMEDGNFEAEFKINGSDASAVYDKKGNKKEVEMTIKTAELPTNVLEYIKTNYPKSKITEAAKITDNKNAVTYEAEIGKDRKSFDVMFDANGKFIKIVEGD